VPGVGILLIWSYLYVTYGIENEKVQASFRCVQVTISAIIFRATFKLADAAIMNKDKTFNWDKGFLCLLNFLVIFKINDLKLIRIHLFVLTFYNFPIKYQVCNNRNQFFYFPRSEWGYQLSF